MYKSQINGYITSGQAKLLSPEEKNNTSFITNYIPHHRVLNISKLDRVRVVFDASAKINKTCLNGNLLPGIDLLNNLVSVITNSEMENMVQLVTLKKCSINFLLTQKTLTC